MKILFAVFLVVHGLIHLMGTAKAFGVADIPQLTQQIAKTARHPLASGWGMIPLGRDSLLHLASTVVGGRCWCGRRVAGCDPHVVERCPVRDDREHCRARGRHPRLPVAMPSSFRAEYGCEIAQGLGRAVATPLLTEADVAQLPTLVQRYIRLNGAVGQPRVQQNFCARFQWYIRSGPSARWMSFTGEQVQLLRPAIASVSHGRLNVRVLFQVFHRFVGPSATMRVKVASVVTMVDAKGPEMDEAETVTLFNDLCVFAPGCADRSRHSVAGDRPADCQRIVHECEPHHPRGPFVQRSRRADGLRRRRTRGGVGRRKVVDENALVIPPGDCREFGRTV